MLHVSGSEALSLELCPSGVAPGLSGEVSP